MKEATSQEFAHQYAAMLERYLAGAGEAALRSAYELGRRALGYESGMLVIAAAHHKALRAILLRADMPKASARMVEEAADFFLECLSPFEMAQRGFQESFATLRDLNDALHRQQRDLRLLLSPMPNLLLTIDDHDCLAAFFVPPGFPSILKGCEVGMPLTDVLPADIVSHIMPAFPEVRRSEQVYRLECPLTMHRQTRYFDLQISPVANSNDVLLVIDDITDRKEIEIAEHRQRVLAEALRDTAIALNSSLDLNEILDHIMTSLGRVVPHDMANIMLIEGAVARIVRRFGRVQTDLGEPEKSDSHLHISPDKTPTLCQVIDTNQAIIISDLEAYFGQYDVTALGRTGSALSAPLLIDNAVIGLINLNSFKRDFFIPLHAENLQTFANHAAVAIKNARLFEQAQEVAALNERQRLARDLHDSVSQALFSATVMAESLPGVWKRQPEKAIERVKELVIVSRGAMAEMRTLLLEIRPDAMLRSRLGDLLKHLAEAAQGRKLIDVQLTVEEEDDPLPPDVHVAFYRMAQESINNIIKHSDATRFSIELVHKLDQLTIRVSDNGKGFDMKQGNAGLGLGTMRERAEAVGAVFDLKSKLGKGTVMTVVWKPGANTSPKSHG